MMINDEEYLPIGEDAEIELLATATPRKLFDVAKNQANFESGEIQGVFALEVLRRGAVLSQSQRNVLANLALQSTHPGPAIEALRLARPLTSEENSHAIRLFWRWDHSWTRRKPKGLSYHHGEDGIYENGNPCKLCRYDLP